MSHRVLARLVSIQKDRLRFLCLPVAARRAPKPAPAAPVAEQDDGPTVQIVNVPMALLVAGAVR